MKKTKKLKILLVLLLVSAFNGSVLPTSAFLLPGSDLTVQPASSGESNLNTFLAGSGDVGGNRDQMGSSSQKDDKVPKVDVVVTPSHPQADEVVYTQALAQNFRNASTSLYFNWYIYNPDPKIGSVVIKNGQKVFVPSNTLSGALIRGAIAQARGSYVPGVTPKAKDLGKNSESTENDRDGYNANFGGDDGKGAIDKDIKEILGKNYDFSYKDFKANCQQNCEVTYSNAKNEIDWQYDKCAKPTCTDWMTSCCNGAKDEFNNCVDTIWDDEQAGCFDQICNKSNKDRKEDCFRGLSLTDYASCDSDFFDAENKCTDTRNLYCINRGSCGTKPSQDCSQCESDFHKSQWGALKQQDLCDKQCEVNSNNSLGSQSVEPVGSRCFRYNFGSRDADDHLAGIFQPMTCFHFYPGADNPNKEINWKDSVPFTTGDGSFKDDEELFWGTDPTNADTDGDNFPDEADIAGLGQQTMQFKFQNGDKVGVVAEGTSLFPTNEKTPYYKIMWADAGVCSAEVIRNAAKDTPEFDNFCRCDSDDKNNCKESKDFGFGYLKLFDIWQSTNNSQTDQLNALIDVNPLRPMVNSLLTIQAIASGNEIDKDLLSYEWTLKHGNDALQPVKDAEKGRIVWKKQGVEAAYTDLTNQLANFKNNGGVGWDKLNLTPLLEGNYSVLVKVVETNGSKQRMGEGTFNFNVNENLKVRFFRGGISNNSMVKKDEITNNETIQGDTVIAEYDGPFYDDFVWEIDRRKLEGNGPQVSLPIEKGSNSIYNIKLVATNKDRTNTAEKELPLKVVNPSASVRIRGEAPDYLGQDTANSQTRKNGLTYQVPQDKDLDFIVTRNPAGSSFSSRDDLHYFWSFDQAEPKEGQDNYKVTLDSNKYLVGTPHSLAVKIYSTDRKLLAQDQITLIPLKDGSAQVVEASRKGILGLALVYLNIPDKLKFTVQTLLWVFFIFLLLNSIAWLFPMRKSVKL
jgi:hypothetical protein